MAVEKYKDEQGVWQSIGNLVIGPPGPEGPQGPPGTTAFGSRVFLWAGDVAQDPGAGGLIVDPTGTNTRVMAVSKFDAFGAGVNLAPLLPGDDITVTDNPDTPPITGFARYVVTGDVEDLGTWWRFNATRTDTSGSQTAPPVGTEVRMAATLSAGTGAYQELPRFEYTKAAGALQLTTVFQRLITLDAGDYEAGVYMAGFAISWIGEDAGVHLVVRTQKNTENWNVYADANTDPAYWQQMVVTYPVEHAGGPAIIALEAKMDGSGAVEASYADLWIQRVK